MENTMPLLKECYDDMINDQGLSIEDGDFSQNVLRSFDPAVLSIVEAELTKLSKEERETLAIGDQEDWPQIFKKLDVPDTVHRVLDEMFMDIGM